MRGVIGIIPCNNPSFLLNTKDGLSDVSKYVGPSFDADFVYTICTIQKDGIEREICSIYGSVQNNALFISDSNKNDGPVFAIIPLDELDKKQPKFYISRSGLSPMEYRSSLGIA